MSKKIIIAIIALIVIVFIVFLATQDREEPVEEPVEETVEETQMEEAIVIAENWIIVEAPTYVFDGQDLALIEGQETAEGVYELTFSFESRQAGYGDRTEEMAAQVITPHIIEVVVQGGEVISAITDGVYDEMRGEMIE